MVVSKRGIWGKREREERRGSHSINMCIEEFLTISNFPSNYAYLKALLFLSILSNFQEKNIEILKLTNNFEIFCRYIFGGHIFVGHSLSEMKTGI